MDIFSYLLGRNSGGGKGALVPQVVTELPATGENGVLYLVARQVTETNNVFDEYIWVNNDYELIGTAQIDLSGKNDLFQYSTMPTASATNVGKIYQYVGTTNANYTKGYFYICVEDSTTTPSTYNWVNIEVQQASSGFNNIIVLTKNDSIPIGSTGLTDNELINAINGQIELFDRISPNMCILINYSNGSVLYSVIDSSFSDGHIYSLKIGACNIRNASVGNNYMTNIDILATYYSIGFTYSNDTLTCSFARIYCYNTTAVNLSYLQHNYLPQTSIAPVYSSSSTYDIGDYVSYQGKLYKCNTAITTAESWTSSHWTETNVMSAIGNINSVLATLTTPSNGGN